MTAAEQGLLLLCCPLEDGMTPLTAAQYRRLRELVRNRRKEEDGSRELTAEDLAAIGCGMQESAQILGLLGRQQVLSAALERWQSRGIGVCTRLSADYPPLLRQRLGDDAPAVLFLLGDRRILQMAGIALVGSRQLRPEGEAFAAAVGRLAAESGHVLISGNARGADQAAQKACLQAGGCVMSFVADRLMKQIPQNRVLYLSEESPERSFSALRALRRNRLIHAAGSSTFVAQVTEGSGGTWSGAVKNLQAGWSPLYVHADGSSGAKALTERGAKPVTLHQLTEE